MGTEQGTTSFLQVIGICIYLKSFLKHADSFVILAQLKECLCKVVHCICNQLVGFTMNTYVKIQTLLIITSCL